MQIRRSLLVVSLIALAACVPAKNADNPDGGAMSQGAATSSAPSGMQDGVTMKGGMMLEIQNGQMSRMDKDMEYEDGTTVKMDGTVTLSDGTTLMLPEGMMITVEGNLQMRADLAVPPAAVITAPPSSNGASSAGAAMTTEATYAAYTDAVLADGKTKVLFFAASWCPVCKEADAYLKTILPSSTYSRSVYKVDYDTAKDLKVKYGVVYQHTFVVVDGNGAKISSVQGPTDVQLEALLK